MLDQKINNVVVRSKAFFKAKTPGHFLVKTSFPVDSPPVPPLYNFDLDSQLTEYLDCKLAAEIPVFLAKQNIDDDQLPATCPYFGIAEHSAWLGMDVTLQQDTCLPILMPNITPDSPLPELTTKTKWFQYMKKGYDHLRSKKDDTFVLAVRGSMMPMDIANALRGDQLFLDLLTDPAFAHKLMQYFTTAIPWYYNQLRSWADNIHHGHVYMPGCFVPGNCFGHTSNDAAMLCSEKIYTDFGYPYEKLITQQYQHVIYHIHNEKMHYVPELLKLPNLSLVELTDDPKTIPCIKRIPEILEMTGTKALMIHATSDQIRNHMNDLKKANVYIDAKCCDKADAEDVIKLIRANSKKL